MNDFFHRVAKKTSEAVGTGRMFVIAITVVAVWAITGPIFGFPQTWQLVINTGTTIVTFLIVFLIQNTQNRDTKVVQLKLDELIRAMKSARNSLVDLEDLSDEELEILQNEFESIQKQARNPKPKR